MIENIKNIKDKFNGFVPYINGSQNMKRASVLIPIVKRDNSYEILFEVRAKTLRSQPNEISFPGGKIEKGENPQDACIRETCEELGTDPENIEIISPLDLYLNHSNLIIHPYVGIIKNIDNLHINKDEVDHVFTAPISYLMSYSPDEFENEIEVKVNDNFPYDRIPNKENYKFASGKYSTLFYEYKNYVIWGITAKILENFLDFLKS
ncbi:NUDIX hydrolase [Intestinibacter sp.]